MSLKVKITLFTFFSNFDRIINFIKNKKQMIKYVKLKINSKFMT